MNAFEVSSKPNLGAVMLYIMSPTRAMLVRDESKRTTTRVALPKLPGGGIEPSDRIGGDDAEAVIDANRDTLPADIDTVRLLQVVKAAWREAEEETGIDVPLKQILFIQPEKWERQGGWETYFPNFCIALVSEETIDTFKDPGNEDGKKINPTPFARSEIREMDELLPRHKDFVQMIEKLMS